MDEILNLDPWTVQNIYFHPTDSKTGAVAIQPKEKTTPLTYRERFFATYKLAGPYPAWRIEQLLAEEEQRQAVERAKQLQHKG